MGLKGWPPNRHQKAVAKLTSKYVQCVYNRYTGVEMPTAAELSPHHTPKGKFAPGNKAAPTTRMRRAPRSLILECTSEDQIRKLVTNAFTLAEKGDPVWATWLLNRIVPPLRPTAPRIEFDLNTDDPAEAAQNILQATSEGLLSSDQAKDLISALASLNEIKQIQELSTEMAELKQLVAK